jgi:hypothetical protein
MRGLSIILFILSVCAIAKIVDLRTSNEQLKIDTTKTIESKNKELTDALERLTVYYLITLEQNKGLEKYQSTRKWKAKNYKLNELQTKLN